MNYTEEAESSRPQTSVERPLGDFTMTQQVINNESVLRSVVTSDVALVLGGFCVSGFAVLRSLESTWRRV